MNPDIEHLKRLLADALALPKPERAAFVKRSCGGDAALRAELERLLESHTRAGDFLEEPPVQFQADQRIETVGCFIGHYKLLEEIGEGGFGRVFMAEQTEPVHRRVALKVVKAGMDTREVIARFEAERQALALMEHPNIARVLDAGATESGRPYFVMELVKGVAITDFCDRNKLGLTARLELFMQVCHAVQHAHQKGIVHRDLKPTNILVTMIDGEPVPKVIDFGIAKALGQQLTDKTLFTRFRDFIGTPVYMSPEQAELSGVDVDTRSDIYSLGVLLYELLTGVTPFDAETFSKVALDEVRRIIREAEPLKPSTRLRTLGERLTEVAQHRRLEPSALARIVHGDLDWIVMKALEKDRARRYSTADSLTTDIQRHLNCEPIRARPPSKIHRLCRLLQRFARQRGAYFHALASERRFQVEAAKAEQTGKFLTGILQGLGPRATTGLDAATRRRILETTAERLKEGLADQPQTEAEVRTALGSVYYDLGDYPAAEQFHQAALTLRRKLHGHVYSDVADSLYSLGRALWLQGKLKAAEKAHREALAIARELFGESHLATARYLHGIASVLQAKGDATGAESLAREALITRRKFLREPHEDIASSVCLLAAALSAQGKTEQAETLFREGLAMRRAYFGDKHPDVAMSLFRLGQVLAAQGKFADAESSFHHAVTIDREVLDRNHRHFLMALCCLANILARQGKFAESEPHYREAAAILRNEAEHGDAYSLNGLAWLLCTSSYAGMRDGAAAVKLAENAAAASNRTDAYHLDTLAAAYAETGQFAKAVDVETEAIALLVDGGLKNHFLARLKLYESGMPYRDLCEA